MRITYHPTKAEARRVMLGAGFTQYVDTSSSGDHGHGSRIYHCRPGAKRNPHGWPYEVANVSKVGREWAACLPDQGAPT